MKTVSEELRELATWLDAEAKEWDNEGCGEVAEDYAGRAKKIEALATRCEGMVSLEAAEEAVRGSLVGSGIHGIDYEITVANFVYRLKGGG